MPSCTAPFPCTDTPKHPGRTPLPGPGSSEDHHTAGPGSHQKELLCTSALHMQMPSQSKGSTWLNSGGEKEHPAGVQPTLAVDSWEQ